MPSRLLLLPLAILQILPLTSLAADSWQIRLTPYLWFAGLKGMLPRSQAHPLPQSIYRRAMRWMILNLV